MIAVPSNARATASVIARIRAEESQLPVAQQQFVDPYATLFDDASAEARAQLEALPFFREQARLRSRFFDDGVRAALQNGVRTIVVLGAGFDTRALRLPEIASSGTRVLEVDFPDQLATKWQRLARAGVTRPALVVCVPLSLSEQNLAAALQAKLHPAGQIEPARVLWLCEGLLAYLKRSDVAELASATFRLSGPGSLLIANHFCPVWSSEELQQLLDGAGWSTARGPSFAELHRRWIGGDVPAGSERYALLSAMRR